MAKYTHKWQGLDQGVEHTWRPEVIETVVKEIAALGSVQYTDPHSPLYARLQAHFPDRTWVSFGTDGSARTIFRRSNTWAKLGLVETLNGKMRLSSLGESFVIGEVDVFDVLINALANHEEHGERPFSIIASAFLESSKHVFTVEEIEYIVMGNYRPEADELFLALNIPHPNTVPATRKRRIRALMSMLVNVDAIAVSGSGWVLKDIAVLSKISGRMAQAQLAAEAPPSQVDTPVKRRSDPRISSRNFQPLTPRFLSNAISTTYDPQKRRELLEKASIGHAQLLQAMASFLTDKGANPIEDPSSYDIACLEPNHSWIFEAKTCTINNAKDQIRKAITQLYEYRWRGKGIWPTETKLGIIIDKNPTEILEDWVVEFVQLDRGIQLIWLEDGIFKVKNIRTSAIEQFEL